MTRARLSTGVSRHAGNAAAAACTAAIDQLGVRKNDLLRNLAGRGVEDLAMAPAGARAFPLIHTGTVSSLAWGLNSAGLFIGGSGVRLHNVIQCR